MTEQYPTVKTIFMRRKNLGKNKLSTVEIEVKFEGKRRWFSTGVRVLPKNWNEKKKVVGLPDAIDLNMKIETLEKLISNYIRKQVVDEKPFTWSGLDMAIKLKKTGVSFISFVESRIATRKDIKESTRRTQKKLVPALKEFGIINSFSDLTKSNVLRFDDWLHSRNCRQSTIASYHKFLKIYINDAIRQELLNTNPYVGIKIDRGKPSIRKYLTQDEVYLINNCKVPESLEKVRDIFLFQCYTGLSYSDLKQFDFTKVIDRGNRLVLHDVRQKTEEDYYIVLLPLAIEVLKKYDYKLPVISNEQYNMRLKIVAEYAGIKKNLTSHMGRHTFATLSLNSGIKIEVLAQMMGHSDIKTTQIYAKMVNGTVEEAYGVLEKNENVKTMVHYFIDILSLLLIVLNPKE